jgi:predicted phosphodiesterase
MKKRAPRPTPVDPGPEPVATGRTLAGVLARDILLKFPQAPSRQLARMLRRDHPAVFSSIDAARVRICYYRGSQGVECREWAKRTIVPEAVRTPEQADAARSHTAKLPRSEASAWLPWVVPAGIERIAVLSDVHMPYHDLHAVETAVAEASKRRPQMVILNGDIMDCYQLSKWQKDPRRRRFKDELATAAAFLDYLGDWMPHAVIKWKLGNHEEWYWRYLEARAPELLGLPQFEPEAVFGLAARGAEIIGDKRIIHAGKLSIIHGHEYPAAVLSPVNAARGYFLRAKSSVLGGHFHQRSEHFEPDLRHKVLGAWSTGCLCDLHPEYARLNRWSHGWAFVELGKAGAFSVENLAILPRT